MSPHVNLWGLALTRQSLVSGRRFRPLFTAAHITLTRSQMMALVPNYFAETYITATAIVSAVVYVLYIIVMKVLAYQSAPIRDLPSPKSVNWLAGSHARNFWEPDAQDTQLGSRFGNMACLQALCLIQCKRRFVLPKTNLESHALQMNRIITTDLEKGTVN